MGWATQLGPRADEVAVSPVRFIRLFSRSNAVVSGKSPFYFSGSRSSEAAGIANGPPRSLQWQNSVDTDRQTK